VSIFIFVNNKLYLCCCQVSGFEESIKNAPLVVVDGNISNETMEFVLQLCSQHNIPGNSLY
jgi:hypothetical protein